MYFVKRSTEKQHKNGIEVPRCVFSMFKYVETVSKCLQMSLMSGGGAAAPVARGPPKETMFEEMARKVLIG